MVATLVRLRLRILAHTLRRDRWRAVVLGAGVLWALSMLPGVLGGLVWVGRQGDDVATDVLAVAGTLLVVGWVTVPLLVPALDDSLDVPRFRTSALPAHRIVPGLLVASLLGVPTAFTALLCLAPALVWAGRGAGPALVALAAAPCALVVCLTGARLSTGVVGRALGVRRSRELGVVTALLGLGAGALVVAGLASLGLEGVLERVPQAVDVLGWTPLAAPWVAPGVVAGGDLGGGLARLAVAAASAALGVGALTGQVRAALVGPVGQGGPRRRRLDDVLPPPRDHGRVPSDRTAGIATARPGRRPLGHGTGPEADVRAAATRAVRVRSTRSWVADPRYQGALLGAVVAPVVVVLLAATVVDAPAAVALAMAPLMAASLGWGRHNDVALDGSAFWMHVVAAVPGVADRAGRALAVVRWAVPTVTGVGLAGALVVRQPGLAPASVGAALGVLGAGLAVSAVSSAVLPYPVPEAGANPYAAPSGAVGASLVAQLVTSAGTLALAAPVLALFVLAVVGREPAVVWATLVVGAGGGAGLLLVGIRLGGRVYDARSVALLERLR